MAEFNPGCPYHSAATRERPDMRRNVGKQARRFANGDNVAEARERFPQQSSRTLGCLRSSWRENLSISASSAQLASIGCSCAVVYTENVTYVRPHFAFYLSLSLSFVSVSCSPGLTRPSAFPRCLCMLRISP